MIYKETDLTNYSHETEAELVNRMLSGDEKARMALAKRKHMLAGDIYLIDGLLANLKQHKIEFPESTAQTIEEAYQEKLEKIREEKERQAEELEQIEEETL